MTLTDYPTREVTLLEGPDHTFYRVSIGQEVVVFTSGKDYEPFVGQELNPGDILVYANVVDYNGY